MVRVRVRFGSSDNITIYPGAIVTRACVGHSFKAQNHDFDANTTLRAISAESMPFLNFF